MRSTLALLAASVLSLSTQAQESTPDAEQTPSAPLALKASESLAKLPDEKQRPTLWKRLRHCDDGTDRSRGWLRHFASSDGPSGPIFATPCDVDWHKPIYILPYTYSRDYESEDTEVLFAVSAKLRPLGPPLYFSYSQRSYWTLYNGKRSRPFRETVYNPEIFYRWMPRRSQSRDFRWGFDGGYEHESNGQDIPESRSWDRLYLAPFFERRGTALQFKLWYRLPEDRKKDEGDAGGDDNPDIEDFIGYSELHFYRRFNPDRRLHVMLRANPNTQHGAIQIEHSWRMGQGDLFWQAYLWHGYGESLTDYNDSITRIGLGFALAR